MKTTFIFFFRITLFVLSLSFLGCGKFVEIPDPIDQIPTDVVFETDAKATAAVRGLYGEMVGSTSVFNTLYAFSGGVQIAGGMSADEMVPSVSSNTFNDFYINNIPANNGTSESNLWGAFYFLIFHANSAINSLEKSASITPEVKAQLLGEAKFIRAANFFYLVNFYGGVPMTTGTDYRVNGTLPRATEDQLYNLIVEDLRYAVDHISATYIGQQRLRANRYAAAALLARVYLYKKDWANAEALSSLVIAAGKTVYDIEPDLSKTFLTTSKEVILQLQQPGSNLYTWDGFNFITIGVPRYLISESLSNAFEAGDLRKTNWIKINTVTTGTTTAQYSFPFKYKLSSGTGTTRTESMVFLRLSEVYLIRAEAKAQQNKLAEAIADLDVVRDRAKIPLIKNTEPGAGQARLLELIMHERFVELFAETGHRWFDLKRTGLADQVLKNKANWKPEAKLYPIPKGEIDKNTALTQNPGYN